jgi:hypothetical protein
LWRIFRAPAALVDFTGPVVFTGILPQDPFTGEGGLEQDAGCMARNFLNEGDTNRAGDWRIPYQKDHSISTRQPGLFKGDFLIPIWIFRVAIKKISDINKMGLPSIPLYYGWFYNKQPIPIQTYR